MKNKKGVLTVEAALIVPLFIFAILFLTQFMKVVYVYDTVQTNLYSTAKFINGYTYLADATPVNSGIDGSNPNLLANTIKQVQETFGDVNANPFSNESMDGYKTALKKDVDTFIKSCLGKGTEAACTSIVPRIALNQIKSDFVSSKGSNYEKLLGLSNLDLSKSKITFGKNGEVRLIATYSVKVEVPFFEKGKTLSLRNQAVIKNFTGK